MLGIKNKRKLINADEFFGALENVQYYSSLSIGLNFLKQISNELCMFNIDIRSKPWYENLMEIYVPKTFEFYNNCKKCNFNIENLMIFE